MATNITPIKVTESSSSQVGAFVQLTPAVPTTNAAQPPPLTSSIVDDVNAKIEKRQVKMEERKLELLMEARNARIHWIRDGEKSSNNRVSSSIDAAIQLNELRACHPDILPCAPHIIEIMLSSNCDWRQCHEKSKNGDSLNRMLMQMLEKQGLSRETVSNSTIAMEEQGAHHSKEIDTSLLKPDLDLPPIPHPESYDAFLDALCNPSAADIVISIQKFCSTIHEAANVMAISLNGENSSVEGSKTTDISLLDGESSDVDASLSTGARSHEPHNYAVSLAKAVRGFINKTIREMKEHEAFHNFVQSTGESNPSNAVSSLNIIRDSTEDRVDLLASLERFIYCKCRRDIDTVILQSPTKVMINSADIKHTSVKTIGEIENELHEKMLSLQFVSAAHLEIRCLKSKTTDARDDIDLSYTIEQLQSIQYQSSPRQIIHSILLAHRGVSYALNEACGQVVDPPGADDVLPTLILATLRAHVIHLPSALLIVETFAPLPLLRGEAGYAYTNLCGAIQFIKDLDVAGHLAEVAILGESGENSAVLSIGPDEFRNGLEECRRKMMMKAEEEKRILMNDSAKEIAGNMEMDFPYVYTNGEKPPHVNISARHIRNAREQGAVVDLDWALEEQQISMWRQGQISDIPYKPMKNPTEIEAIAGHEHLKHRLPPEDPSWSSQFTRSYSFLTTHPDNISLRDLPQLLKEYKMLVHATEVLLSERLTWRESERKRMVKLEREHLERDLADALGADDRKNGATK